MQYDLNRCTGIELAGSRKSSRGLLLAGVSAMALLLANNAAHAGGKPLSAMVGASPTTATINSAQQGSQQAAEAVQRAQASMARSTQAIQAIQAAQAAARDLARNAPSPVTNGLAPGGLVPVANPLPVELDTTGKQTWVGALQPTQTVGANGHVDVTVKQTQTKALLSWDSFNVGRNTTLTFDQQDASYTALNRVVGSSTAPSQILGNINAKGTVLIINQNGIVFSGSSQINVGSLIATSSEVGTNRLFQSLIDLTLVQRNRMFMQYGLLGYADSLGRDASFAQTFSALPGNNQGEVKIEQGASISTAGENGLILLLAPHVTNAGHLSAPSGQVMLVGGSGLTVSRATGAADSVDPNVRGLLVVRGGGTNGYVWNQAEGLIEANRGNITLVTSVNGSRQVNINGETVSLLVPGGAIINDGVLSSTTSVSRNGSIIIDGANIRFSSGSVMSIAADTGGETVPLDPTSLLNFKPSEIKIGSFNNSSIEMQSGALLYAPGANVIFNAPGGASTTGLNNFLTVAVPQIFIDSGAVIDVAGLKDVSIPASRNEVVITPVKGNELRDSPLYRASFLNGSTVYLDPRVSGVRSDGVAWIGSPLIDAASYYFLVGVGASELMTKGGTVIFSAATYNGTGKPEIPVTGINAGSVTVKSGATIDISGGWVTYQAGQVRTTQLVTADGHVVDIGKADPNGMYRGIYGGFTVNHAHWGVSETYTDKIRSGSRYQAEYTEGRDAGALTMKAAAAAFDGTIYGQAYAGQKQLSDAKAGTGKSAVYGDGRAVQGASSELPAGGMLFIQADAGGADIAVLHDPAKLPDSFGYGQSIVIGADGSYTPPARDPASVLPAPRLNTIQISDSQISSAGLSEVALYSNGAVTVAADANVALNPGGVFNVLAGRNIKIDGKVSAAGGKMSFETFNSFGSLFVPTTAALGSFDIVVNGTLDVAGRWVNDRNATLGTFGGAGWLNGGSISMYAASRDLVFGGTGLGGILDSTWGGVRYDSPGITSADISGSILINAGSRLDLTGGGRIDQKGKFNLTAKGGNLSLASDTGYYQIGPNDGIIAAMGFRIRNVSNVMVANPSEIRARIAIDSHSIEAHGFGGGGTFTLITPEFSFGTGTASTGTRLPMDFFSTAGFGTYNITSYKTDLSPSTFNNGRGGYNAVLATQTLTVGAGETLSLVQSVLPSILNATQADALRNLASGGDVLSVLSPMTPDNAWDSKGISLNLGGLLELHVAQGGSVIGVAGSSLSAAKLFNEGKIRLPGGTITQQLLMPSTYGSGFSGDGAIGVHKLSDILSTAADGSIDVNALNAMGVKDGGGHVLTNTEVAGGTATVFARPIYLLGLLEQDQGIVLAPGSVTDLSGAVIVNPRAVGSNGRPIADGRILAGGTLASPIAVRSVGGPMFRAQANSYFARLNPTAMRIPELIIAQPGSTLDLSGAAGAFDRLTMNDGPGLAKVSYTSTPVWSDAGNLLAANGATLAGATINAHGGTPQANGGTLQVLDPTLVQHDPATPTANVISADMIANAGFDTLSAIGSVSSSGNAKLQLDRGFFLEGNVFNGVAPTSNGVTADQFIPVVKSTGGILEIDARYIGINGMIDVVSNPNVGVAGTGSVIFKGDTIDITGAVIFDRSVANATLEAKGDIRLTGVPQWQPTFTSAIPTSVSLMGALAANGNVSLVAGQSYPTTGSAFTISSTAANGTITFGRSGTAIPATPYSAGGSLSVYAANIVQGGVVRVPFGTLTLGSNTAFTKTASSVTTTFAPAAQNVTLLDGSVTAVSADGLIIPYGTTTDQKEWYFAPTGVSALSGPPAKVLSISGSNIAINSGATVDLTGGGDVYAYEFVPGTGGSRDVLDRLNADPYSSNSGYQYPAGRQVYAIVPGISDAPAALRDPLYSADYGNLYSSSAVGQRVYLDAAPGVAAGWYTLLPAKYALLPGGMRVVEQTGATVMRGVNIQNSDGSVLVTGYYGDAISGSYQSDIKQFSIESQAVIRQNSKIILTSGSKIATAQAATAGTLTPRLGVDAGQLILSPLASLRIDTVFASAAAPGGRGSQVDIGGTNFDILSTLSNAPADGAIHVTASSLTNLNAGSLLIGGIRTDNADGTTSLNITAQKILVANDAASPLSAPEIILAVDDHIKNSVASSITLADGATIIATGALTDQRSGNYVLDGRVTRTIDQRGTIVFTNPIITAEGALFRVANGPERLVQRLRDDQGPVVPAASLVVGNITAKGTSIGLDTSGSVSLASNTALQARSISLGAPAIAFTSAASVPGTVILTPQLQALLSQGDHLTLHAQTTIGFDDGTYQFKSATLDARNLVSRQGGTVAIAADQLTLSNATSVAGVAAGGTGTLNVIANEITFGSGALATTGFGGGVNLTGSQGVFTGGTGGAFDVGNANLQIVTPYLGDRNITGGSTEKGYDVTIKTVGTVLVTNAGTTALDPGKIVGVPGSGITILGNGISISGTHVRATAGALNAKSTGNLVLANGAWLEAPGYAKIFGDAADPVVRSAPGGVLSLVAQGAGGIDLGDSTVSVGGGIGNGGKLSLSTPNGNVNFGTAMLDGAGAAGNSGGIFAIDTRGSLDLVALNTRVGAFGFTGGFDVRTRTGDIVLGAGQMLRSGSVNLTADGGFVTVGGTIDTSGVNGGNISLYGTHGVALQDSARLNAYATGYAADDTRQARAGNVTLGTDYIPGTAVINADGKVTGTSGSISLASGALVDVSAKRAGDRLVRLLRNGVTYYQYVQADQSGSVNFRAPVYQDVNNHQMVNIAVANAASIVGAASIAIEGFRRWDLAAVANSGSYTGVTYDSPTNTVTLDVRTGLDTANVDGTLTTVAGVNFLGDKAPGTVVDYIQNFDISSSYGALGGLASQSNFHARPGIDLDTTGNIVLASNWNLGAGTVNLTAAVAAGNMTVNPALQVSGDPTSGYVAVSGREDDILANNTKLTYRTGGSVSGESGVVALRAGGNLDLKGSLTDGFFLFRDQTNETYLNKLGITFSNYNLALNGGFNTGNGTTALTQWSTWTGAANPAVYLGLSVGSASSGYLAGTSLGGVTTMSAPYSAIGNSPAALGSFVADATGNINGGGDPISSAVVFPLLPNGSAASSWSYSLVAGAANLAGGSVGRVSADPSRVDPGSSASLIVEGRSTYKSPGGAAIVGAAVPGVGVDTNTAFGLTTKPTTGATVSSFADWLTFISGANFTGVSDAAVAVLYIGVTNANPVSATDPNRTLILNLFNNFAASHGLVQNSPNPAVGWRLSSPTATQANTQYIAMSVANFKAFVAQALIPNQAQIEANLQTKLTVPTQSVTAGVLTQTVTTVRTGTGSINMVAAGDVDLRGSAAVTYLDTRTGAVGAAPSQTNQNTRQLGGVAVYTVGRIADTTSRVVTDPVSGLSVTIDPSGSLPTTSVFATPQNYNYGKTTGSPGIMVADPVYLEGGGDISVSAGNDVLGRRDLALQTMISSGIIPSWIGSLDQLWRLGTIGNATNVAINPQLFREGLGALGGGNILVSAGRDVSDISTIADNSLLTGKATPTTGLQTSALLSFGSGNVVINAGRDIVGGRLDVASGAAELSAGRDVKDAASIVTGIGLQSYIFADGTAIAIFEPQSRTNQLRVRISDTTAAIEARGSVTLQGVAALGVAPPGYSSDTANATARDNRYGFYSAYGGLDLLANGSITVTNDGATNLVGSPYYDLSMSTSGGQQVFVYPGSLTVASIASDINVVSGLNLPTGGQAAIVMVPSKIGRLEFFAGRNIAPITIGMLDNDPGQSPGLFSAYVNDGRSATGGMTFAFPTVLSSTSDYLRGLQHNSSLTHAADSRPVYFYAGNDIGTAAKGVTLSVPKQARVNAGRDLVNMMFLGQNLSADDVTRVVAGRDIIATTKLVQPTGTNLLPIGAAQPTMQGNTFVIGGPGEFFLEAGRNLGPFLNSALSFNHYSTFTGGGDGITINTLETYAGGVMSVGNQWNPYLSSTGADVNVLFGVGKGADYIALRDAYVTPGTAANTLGDYGAKLVAWMQQNAKEALVASYGTTDVSAADAYTVFVTLPQLRQRVFLINDVYFNELRATADKNSVSYLKYSRGYAAVNTLFPASLGYTANSLEGGAIDTAIVATGDLDLRLATIETMYGGNVNILGPGGRVLAGSVVSTSQQAARRTYDGARLYSGSTGVFGTPSIVEKIPSGAEGVLTLRGGNINTFTDGDFLLNQSRLFTEQGGDILMWSSNADLNAGQGPKTSANFPPVVVHVDQNGFVTVDTLGGVTGAGIAALKSTPKSPLSNVFLIAPRGTVDAGDAGVRVSGNLSVAARFVLNADNFKVGGSSIGVPTITAPDVGGLTSASNTVTTKNVDVAPKANSDQPSIIIVEFLGFGGSQGGDSDAGNKPPAPASAPNEASDEERKKQRR